MVQLAFSTNGYSRFDLPEAIRRIADHGYDVEGVNRASSGPRS